MKSTKFKIGVMDLVLLIISVFFFVGIRFVFGPCAPHEDGSFMTCHWAGNAVAGLAAVLGILAIIHLFVQKSQIKLGLSLAVIPVSVLACLIPGRMISLCMMQEMRCRAVMTPAVIVCSVLLIVAAVIDVVIQYKRDK